MATAALCPGCWSAPRWCVYGTHGRSFTVASLTSVLPCGLIQRNAQRSVCVLAAQTFVTCLGLGSLFVAFPVLHQILRITGALYLVFLARKLSASSLGDARETKPLSFAQAALFQAVNPKSWVKSITLASVFMILNRLSDVGGSPCFL